jgi:hypothetical protein
MLGNVGGVFSESGRKHKVANPFLDWWAEAGKGLAINGTHRRKQPVTAF